MKKIQYLPIRRVGGGEAKNQNTRELSNIILFPTTRLAFVCIMGTFPCPLHMAFHAFILSMCWRR